MGPLQKLFGYAINRQALVQLAIALSAYFGITSEDINWDDTIGAIFAGGAAVTAVWTIITRLFKPAPNLTATAAAKERELVAKGVIKKQGGFARVGLLLLLAAIFGAGSLVMSGCAGTQAAYREARDNLSDTAYVTAELYAVTLREAADLRQQPGTPRQVIEALQAADRVTKPFVIGDPARELPGLRELSARWESVRDAKTEAELQAAINDAIREVTKFSRAVKAARGTT